MSGYLVEQLSQIAGPSDIKELERIQINFLEDLFSKANPIQRKEWLEENDFEIFSSVINSEYFSVLEYLVTLAKEHNISIGIIINTTLEKYNIQTLSNLLIDFIKNPNKNDATKELIKFISEKIKSTQMMEEQNSESEAESESEPDSDIERDDYLISSSPDLLEENTKIAPIIPEARRLVTEHSAFEPYKAGKKRSTDAEESAQKTAAINFGKGGSAFKPFKSKTGLSSPSTTSANSKASTVNGNSTDKTH